MNTFQKTKSLGATVKVESDLFNYSARWDLKNPAGAGTLDLPKTTDLDVDKLVPVPVDLSKLSGSVRKDVVKKDLCNAKIKKLNTK